MLKFTMEVIDMNPIYRKSMLESEIQKLLSEAISNMKDPRIKREFITVSRVVLSKDKRYADVYISYLGLDNERKEMLEILERAKGYLRSYIAKNLRIYTTPEIRLHEDRGIESSVRIQKILSDLGYDKPEEEKDEEA